MGVECLVQRHNNHQIWVLNSNSTLWAPPIPSNPEMFRTYFPFHDLGHLPFWLNSLTNVRCKAIARAVNVTFVSELEYLHVIYLHTSIPSTTVGHGSVPHNLAVFWSPIDVSMQHFHDNLIMIQSNSSLFSHILPVLFISSIFSVLDDRNTQG